MDFSWLAEPHTWIGFATLLVLEVVLGIDNLVFVAILANKVKPAKRDRARITAWGWQSSSASSCLPLWHISSR